MRQLTGVTTGAPEFLYLQASSNSVVCVQRTLVRSQIALHEIKVHFRCPTFSLRCRLQQAASRCTAFVRPFTTSPGETYAKSHCFIVFDICRLKLCHASYVNKEYILETSLLVRILHVPKIIQWQRYIKTVLPPLFSILSSLFMMLDYSDIRASSAFQFTILLLHLSSLTEHLVPTHSVCLSSLNVRHGINILTQNKHFSQRLKDVPAILPGVVGDARFFKWKNKRYCLYRVLLPKLCTACIAYNLPHTVLSVGQANRILGTAYTV